MLEKPVNEVFDKFEAIDNYADITSNSTTISPDIRTMEDALMNQIENLNHIAEFEPEDKFSPLFNSISILRKSLSEQPEVNAEKLGVINTYTSDLRQKLFSIMKSYIGIDENSNAFGSLKDLESSELHNFIEALYKFLVTYRLENLVNYVYNMVNRNFKALVQTYKPLVNRQDLGAKDARRKAKSLDCAVVLDRIDDITKDILSGSFEVEDFLSELTKGLEDEWQNAMVIEEFEAVNIPNLEKAYIGDILESPDSLRQLTMKVYSLLSERYKGKPNE
jgi:hypothetical protein